MFKHEPSLNNTFILLRILPDPVSELVLSDPGPGLLSYILA